jgi:hypothetical protein
VSAGLYLYLDLKSIWFTVHLEFLEMPFHQFIRKQISNMKNPVFF